MTIEITVRVPDALGQQLAQVQDRLPEVLARGLQAVLSDTGTDDADATAIIALLASQPTPAQVLALRPSPAFQARVSDLLLRSKAQTLTAAETAELERALLLEHLVRLAKTTARQRLAPQP